MASRITDCVQGYTGLASSLLEQWSDLASKSASKMDAGTYTPSSAAQDAVAATALAAQAGWSWTTLWWECFGGAGGFEGEATKNRSQKFQAPKAGAKLEVMRTFMSGPGLEELPPGAVSIHPEQLESGKSEFTLRADGVVCPGATYVSEVAVIVGEKRKSMWVWITVT